MLRYLGHGFRQFGLYPLVSKPRVNWEFYAVVIGQCAPLLKKNETPRFKTKRLWVFRPGSSHGWVGVGAKKAYITSFHFGSVPPQLDSLVKLDNYCEVELNNAEAKRLVALADELEPHFKKRTNLSNLLFQGALTELTLLVLRKIPEQIARAPENEAERTVELATQWFSERVQDNPPVSEVAREMHVSVSTLRRRFHSARRSSPAHVFEKIRIGVAMQLMTKGNSKLDAIAVECGYSCTSDFCRAFKLFTSITPNAWRQTLIGPPDGAD